LTVSPSATVRVMSAEEITARAGGTTPFLLWPDRQTLFAQRAMRLRQLATSHAMGDYFGFLSQLALAQQQQLQALGAVPLPDEAALDRAAHDGVPPLPAVDWPRDPAWHGVARALAAELLKAAPTAAHGTLRQLQSADAEWLERQADCVLTGVLEGLDMGAAPIVGAALQVYWSHMVLTLQQRAEGRGASGQPFGRIDDETACPCCGSRPTASVTRSEGDSTGQRYLYCSLCATQWHMVRIKCAHCGSGKSLAYQSLDTADGADDETASRAARAAVQAETCDDCGHYLKILHTDRDPLIEPVADDLASLTLDLLVSDTGQARHGVNLLLVLGDGARAASGAPPPDPGAA
jgi:FdhE protein